VEAFSHRDFRESFLLGPRRRDCQAEGRSFLRAATEVISPSPDDRVDRLDQLIHSQRHTALGQGSDRIFESVHCLLSRNGLEILSAQRGFDPVAGQLELSFPTLDFVSKKLEALRNVHNPRLLPVEPHQRSGSACPPSIRKNAPTECMDKANYKTRV
jgi:hypothetical protein